MGKPSTEIDVIHALLEAKVEAVPSGHDMFMNWCHNNERYIRRVMDALPDLLILADNFYGNATPEAAVAHERLRNWSKV